MYKTFTLLFLFISFYPAAQPGCDYPRPCLDEKLQRKMGCGIIPTVKTKLDSGRIFLRCGVKTEDPDAPPLFIIDGKIQELWKIKAIDPNTIESISILKRAEAMAIYGSEGAAGAIVIELKNIQSRTFIIIDETDRGPIPGATMMFVSANSQDTTMLTAGLDGRIVTNKLRKNQDYEVCISSVAYDLIQQQMKWFYDQTDTITMTRKVIECKPVVITDMGFRSTCCYSNISVTRIKQEKTEVLVLAKKISKPVSFSTVRFFPNPVVRGAEITIETGQKNVDFLQLTDLMGRVVLLKKNKQGGEKIMKLLLDPRLAAGTYFVQLIYENGQVYASGKIIIQ